MENVSENWTVRMNGENGWNEMEWEKYRCGYMKIAADKIPDVYHSVTFNCSFLIAFVRPRVGNQQYVSAELFADTIIFIRFCLVPFTRLSLRTVGLLIP